MMGLKSAKVKIVDKMPKGNNYLQCANTIMRCFGKMILSKDEDFDFFFIEIDFSGYHKTYIRLWSEDHVAHYLPSQNSDDSGVDCVHSRGKNRSKDKGDY